ncbi:MULTISPECIES: hypothetical protein [Sorangium]|uniref:Uncharacterized protein n=1 Tax=Sorangium cellulosum (strain So ce56) TaxID=448385 RepID=A9FW32_SORC5|nr:hypothetical protein [Sorangium cellulosum]CAN92338.1 hypothetical protein predicted by Glimmer/Critica [Sorangium cellulosum So ce56]
MNALAPDERTSSPVIPVHARTARVPHCGIPPHGDDAFAELVDEAIWLGHMVVSLRGRAVATRSRRRSSPLE